MHRVRCFFCFFVCFCTFFLLFFVLFALFFVYLGTIYIINNNNTLCRLRHVLKMQSYGEKLLKEKQKVKAYRGRKRPHNAE